MSDQTAPVPQTAGPVLGLRALVLYILGVAAYTLPFIGQRALFYRDEVRYGGIIREMMADGTWWTQTIAGLPYLDKGPVYFMLLRAGAELAGGPAPWVFFAVNAVTVLLFVVAAHVALRWLGASESRAELAGLILLSLPFTAFYALTLRMDPLFAGAILLSFAGFARGLGRAHPMRDFLIGGAFSGLAVLIKGPFGFAFPYAALLVAALVTGDGRRLISWPMLAALGVTGALVGTWFLTLLAQFGWPAMVNIAEVQLVERALNSVDGRKPWHTYLTALPLVLLPWLLLAPWLRRSGLWQDRGTRLWIVFIVVSMVIMQVVAQKSAKYLFPVLPPLTLLLAIALERAEASAPWVPRVLFGLAAALVGLVFAALWWGTATRADWLAEALAETTEPRLKGLATAGLLAAAVLAAAVWLSGWRRVVPMIAATAILMTGLKAALVQDLNRVLDPGPAVDRLLAELPADAPVVVVVDFYRGSFSWHLAPRSHHYTFGDTGPAETIAGASRPLGLLVDAGTAFEAPAWLAGAQELGRHRIESREVVIYVLP